ncbi:conserved hypothetical protein [uncultured Alphaproteobacteria bacterium]|uniref:Uncharacterized protein n=1 Tax=uncultured Alphaproteobacteria bacterium TaxID=91750 RepID=A0A212KLY6_9PROT|nr:conserved hypothetical protein [uncultured Alphaproteobacteria bacterium]
MMHLSDRRRVELALPAAVMHRVVSQSIAEGERSDDDREVLALLREAAAEPFDGLNAWERPRLMRRVDRLSMEVMAELMGGARAKAFLALTLWLKGMLDDGTLALIEGSAFDRAMGGILATMEDAPEVMAAVDRSATKAAWRISRRLSGLGYYPAARREAAE